MVGKAWQSKKFRPAVKFAEIDRNERGGSLADVAAEQERRRSSVVAPGEKVSQVEQGEKTYQHA